jgi:hypothetical protein
MPKSQLKRVKVSMKISRKKPWFHD